MTQHPQPISLEDQITQDMQRKISDDVVRAAERVLALLPPKHYFALLMQGGCSMLEFTSEFVEFEMGFSPRSRRLTVFLVALMCAHAYQQPEPVTLNVLLAKARDDLVKLGLFRIEGRDDRRDQT